MKKLLLAGALALSTATGIATATMPASAATVQANDMAINPTKDNWTNSESPTLSLTNKNNNWDAKAIVQLQFYNESTGKWEDRRNPITVLEVWAQGDNRKATFSPISTDGKYRFQVKVYHYNLNTPGSYGDYSSYIGTMNSSTITVK